MTNCTLKWFNIIKGFDVIAPDVDGKDVFARKCDLLTSGDCLFFHLIDAVIHFLYAAVHVFQPLKHGEHSLFHSSDGEDSF